MKTKSLHLGAVFMLTASMELSTSIHAQTISASRDSWSDYSLAICNNGTLMAWGDNDFGKLGNGSTTGSNVPIQVTGLSSVIAVRACSTSTIALKFDGTVWAWGENFVGQLGNGNNTNSNVPLQVSLLTDVIAIAGGSYHSFALKNDGTVWTWGSNSYGQLGNGNNTASNIPLQVSSLTGVIAIAGSSDNSYALKNDGTVWAWGDNNYGQLGNGNNTASNVPVKVNITNVIAIAGNLVIKNDSTVWAWGDNYFGQLGNGNNTMSNVPVKVNSLSGITYITNGYFSSYALKNDSTIWAWGGNYYGQLGDGSTNNSNIPVKVNSLTGITAISGGGYFALATKNDGTLWSWGNNSFGQLGTGNTTSSNIPLQVSGLCPVTMPPECMAHYTVAYDSIQNEFTLMVDSLTSFLAVNYHWDFGDGTTSTLPNPPLHTYIKDTLYNVCLEITTASGAHCAYYHVIGKDASGNIIRTGGFLLNVINSNIPTNTPIPINSEETKIVIYPNPTNGNITVMGDNINTIDIYNVLGEKIYTTSNFKQQISNEIDLSKSPKGIYFVTIYDKTKMYNQKIIIQ